MRHPLTLLCILLSALSISACGTLTNEQIINTHAFGSATVDIGKFGETEFVDIRNNIIAMNQALLIIDNSKTANDIIFDQPTSIDATVNRIAACTALKQYGELLLALVTKDQTQNLQRIANDLTNNTYLALHKDLPAETQDAVSRLIIDLGSYFVEAKKARAVRTIVTAYADSIDQIADLLSMDFSTEAGTLGYLKAYDTTARRLKNAAIKVLARDKSYNLLERDKAVQALVFADTTIARAQHIGKYAQDSIAMLKAANHALKNSINNHAYSASDIKAYARNIKDLTNMYRVLSK